MVVKDRYREKVEYQLALRELITAARHRGTVTYQEVALATGLPLWGSIMGSEVGHLVGEISEDEHFAGRPMLSAICVKKTLEPGPGFFGLARKLGELSDRSKAAQRAFLEQERDKVYKTWAIPIPKRPKKSKV